MHLEANHHIVAYADTDSLLSFPARAEAPGIEKLCQISERLGCLKVEKEGVSKFFSTAAKTYSLETKQGEITIKAKGFNLLEKLLKDNSSECLLEKNVSKMFTGVSDLIEMPDSSTLVYQKQIKVDPVEMVPALLGKDKSYKLLNFIGPRRQIDLDNWLTFRFERVAEDYLKKTTINPLETFQPLSDQDSSTKFSCDTQNTSLFTNERKISAEVSSYKVILVPKVKGLLPALPYGFSLNRIDLVLPFYKLVMPPKN